MREFLTIFQLVTLRNKMFFLVLVLGVAFVSVLLTAKNLSSKINFLQDTFCNYFKMHEGSVAQLIPNEVLFEAKDAIELWLNEYENISNKEIFLVQYQFARELALLEKASEFQLISRIIKSQPTYKDKALKASDVCWKIELEHLCIDAKNIIAQKMFACNNEQEMIQCLNQGVQKLPDLNTQRSVRQALDTVVKDYHKIVIDKEIQQGYVAVDAIFTESQNAIEFTDKYAKLISKIQNSETLSSVKAYGDAQLKNFTSSAIKTDESIKGFGDVCRIFRSMTHLPLSADLEVSEFAEDYQWIQEEWNEIAKSHTVKEGISLATKMLELRLRNHKS